MNILSLGFEIRIFIKKLAKLDGKPKNIDILIMTFKILIHYSSILILHFFYVINFFLTIP